MPSGSEAEPRRVHDTLAFWVAIYTAVFGGVTVVVASTGLALLTKALVALATLVICVLLAQLTASVKRRGWTPTLIVWMVAEVALAISLIVAAKVLAPADPAGPTVAATTTTNQASPTSRPPAPAPDDAPDQQLDHYVLRESSSPTTNDQDKLDLDTACPGWGNQRPRIGNPRCGELADLILDIEGLHNANERPSLVLLPAGSNAGQQTCAAALDEGTRTSQIEAAELSEGAVLCVRTDLAGIAAVHIEAADFSGVPAQVTISYQLWNPAEHPLPNADP